MFSSKGLLALSLLPVVLSRGTLSSSAYAASSDGDVASKLKADYALSHVGTIGLKIRLQPYPAAGYCSDSSHRRYLCGPGQHATSRR